MVASFLSCEMKGHWGSLNFIMIVFILFVLLNGCATLGTVSENTETGVPPESKNEASREPIKEVNVNEFILGVGDKIEITVYRYDDLKKTIQIDPSGKITYPLAGDIQAGGVSLFKLRDIIQDRLSKYIIDPQVTVSISSIQSQKVAVLGEVNVPGLFTLESTLTALEAISKAQGFTKYAKKNNVLLIRGGLNKPELIILDMSRFFSEGDMAQNRPLQNGDILYVPESTIENVARFFDHLSRILQPILTPLMGFIMGAQ